MVKVRVGVLSVVQFPATRLAGPRVSRVGVELEAAAESETVLVSPPSELRALTVMV